MSTAAGADQHVFGGFSSRAEERKWNRLSETMNSFHTWFKQEFNTLYDLADGSFNGRGMSLTLYLDSAQRMNQHLTMHHKIEESHLFPLLGSKMPKFSVTANDGAHILSHRGIHEGLDRLEQLVRGWKSAPSTYSPVEMKECLDSFRDVLFHHLDEEVEDLKGENIRKYLTLDDLENLPL